MPNLLCFTPDSLFVIIALQKEALAGGLSHMVTVDVHDGVTATIKTIVTAG